MLFGTNSLAWDQVSSDVKGLTSYRCYFGNLPAIWPDTPSGVVPIVSIKPNVGDLLAGKLDKQLALFCASAPSGAMLTAYHEGNRYMSAAQMKAVHAYIGKRLPSRMSFGAIYSTYKVMHGQDLTPYIEPGLAFYTFDGYQVDSAADTPTHVFSKAWKSVRAVVGSVPRLGITETNSRFDQTSWIKTAYRWAESEDAFAFAPFFNSPPSDPNPYKYPPGAGPVLAELAIHAALI